MYISLFYENEGLFYTSFMLKFTFPKIWYFPMKMEKLQQLLEGMLYMNWWGEDGMTKRTPPHSNIMIADGITICLIYKIVPIEIFHGFFPSSKINGQTGGG